jgi:2'-5' RNA ligase
MAGSVSLRLSDSPPVGLPELADEAARAIAPGSAVQERAARLGRSSVELRPSLPHVTVLRFRWRAHLRAPPPARGPCMPSDAALYHSTLRSGGAQYDVVDSFSLGGNN